MLFEKDVDYVHLKNLMEMIRDNLKLNGLDCMSVSKIYKSFEWLQGLEHKMNLTQDIERNNQDLKEALENENKGLTSYIEELEAQIKELTKKKRTTKKKK